jgi:hypothetical protein
VKASTEVLKADKELLVFPLLSGVAVLLVSVSFFVPLSALGIAQDMGQGQLDTAAYVLVFLFYVSQYAVVFFFNSALVGAAMLRLGGENPTVTDGLQIAVDRLGAILGYAVIAATVGMILRTLSERAGWAGRIAVGLAGMAWNLATYLVVPVLVTTDVGPIRAIRLSASAFRETWGEQVVGNIGMGLAFFLMFVSVTLFAVPGTLLASQASQSLFVAAIVFFGAAYLLLVLVSSALSGIYSAALYRYTVTGEAGWGFDPRLLERAFVPRGRRGW